jgi:alanine dehydrogenase
VNAVYLLVDGPTGQPRALIEGASLTVRRTAAASALAARYLVRTNASRMLMVGAGALSRPLIEAHCSQRSIKRVQLWARDTRKRDAKVKELVALGLPVEPADDLERSAREADLISCATLSKEPLIRGAWLKSGAHLDLVGAFTPEMRESDDGAVGRASLFCDTRAGAMKEGGDLVIPLKAGLITEAAIKADLADLARGKHKGRMSEDEVTLFKSVGTAIEDFAAARLAMQRRQQR